MKKIFLIFNFSFLIFNFSFAQPAIQWQKCLGGTDWDVAESIRQTSDGGYIVAGSTLSDDGDVSGNHGSQDFWLVKLDNNGNIQWQKCLGGTDNEVAFSVQQTTDGGYIVGGHTGSNDGDVTGSHGIGEYWIVKLNSGGNIQWQKCFGGTNADWGASAYQTADGGYIVAGTTISNDGDVTGNHGSADYWIVKLDTSGNIQWQKCLGGALWDGVYSVQQTIDFRGSFDKGYIVAGYTYSNDGDVSGNHDTTGQYADYWIVMLDSTGNIQWQKCFGGTGDDVAHSVQQTTDGGYVVAGTTGSFNGDVTGNHGNYDFWVTKLDDNGNLQWQKCFGGINSDGAESVHQTADGGYIIAGTTSSYDGNVTGIHGSDDYWLVKLSSSGNLQWQKCLGGSDWDQANSVYQTDDGGYIIAGATQSNNGDVTGWHGNYDYWIVKLSPYVGIEEETNNNSCNIYPNPFTANTVISFSKPVYNAMFSLYNLLGEKVSEAADISGEGFEFNRGNLQSGVYFFEVTEKEKTIARGKAIIY